MRWSTSWTMGFTAMALAVSCGEAAAQVPWGGAAWRIEAVDSRLERHTGRTALLLKNGIAWLEGSALRDGVISFDMLVSQDLGFHGIAFRGVDSQNYEHFYLRPFVIGNPDASQYTPVHNGVSGWQIYTGPRFGGAIEVPGERWMHVELRVREGRAEAYVDGQPLVFPALQRAPVRGAIGLTSSGAPARFANVSVSSVSPVLEAGVGAAAEDVPRGLIRQWRVSPAFPESRLDSLARLDSALIAELEWVNLNAGERGIADLARVRMRDVTNNTVIAATTLWSNEARPVRLRFGFSDAVHVYLNGRPIFRGSDGWRSRDYKFLGTIGLFYELVLPLEAGANEVWLAVRESFGGWGVIAQVVDRPGVEIRE